MNSQPGIQLSVMAPAHNERDNLSALVAEIAAALDPAGLSYEIIIVDDGSTDDTPEILAGLRGRFGQLRTLRMAQTPPGRGNGQSAAFHAGIRAARGPLIAMLDADLQNDPADVPAMLAVMEETGADLVQGDRSRNRRDSLLRKVSSWVGRAFRRTLLGDTVVDTGCSLRVMKRDVALRLPLEFRGAHRYIPITTAQMGFRVVEVRVSHRPRVAGTAKYGVWNRAIPGLFDCMAFRWMGKRRRPVMFRELTDEAACDGEASGIAAQRQPEVSRS